MRHRSCVLSVELVNSITTKTVYGYILYMGLVVRDRMGLPIGIFHEVCDFCDLVSDFLITSSFVLRVSN